MNEPLDELYLGWLYSQINSVKITNPARTYWSLFRQLFKKPFIWLIPNDDNRVEDGRDLRLEFAKQEDVLLDQDWFDMPCSVLEMLIALARRLCFEDGNDVRGWFWELLENMDLVFTDDEYTEDVQQGIDQALDRLIWRLYLPDGRGGIFPLDRPTRDQREVEIWYQLNEYLMERS